MKKKMPIAEILHEKRDLAHLSIDEVVAKLQERGVDISAKTLYGYENGVSMPKVNTFLYLCDIYGITDIMGTFGYASCVAAPREDWSVTLYNDFFNADLLGKIYILIREGIPSFDGYGERLESIFPSDSEEATFDKLYSLFVKFNEVGQGVVIGRLMELANDPSLLKDEYAHPSAASADVAG